ncbi:hypothetical protein [Nostoc sp. CHAB 5715]|nr:hypothetical protein [Nostoc sp. CHAB 5715]
MISAIEDVYYPNDCSDRLIHILVQQHRKFSILFSERGLYKAII